VLNSLLEPASLPPPQSRAELAREERSTLVETAKDKWNEEMENAVRWVHRTDWSEVREGMEGAVSRFLGTGLQKSRESIEEAENKAGPKVEHAVDRSKTAASKDAEQAAASIDRAGASMITGVKKSGAEAKKSSSKIADAMKSKTDSAVASTRTKLHQAGVRIDEYEDAVKVKADRTVADAKTAAHNTVDAIQNRGGTVNVTRGVVRDANSKGIEKGKEALGKAQAMVGSATDEIESKVQPSSLSHSSAVEKTLKERYEKPNGLNKSVEDALAERYEPIDTRDNTVLRGV
jgi:altered-inheritance-of-mitochondria protein 5